MAPLEGPADVDWWRGGRVLGAWLRDFRGPRDARAPRPAVAAPAGRLGRNAGSGGDRGAGGLDGGRSLRLRVDEMGHGGDSRIERLPPRRHHADGGRRGVLGAVSRVDRPARCPAHRHPSAGAVPGVSGDGRTGPNLSESRSRPDSFRSDGGDAGNRDDPGSHRAGSPGGGDAQRRVGPARLRLDRLAAVCAGPRGAIAGRRVGLGLPVASGAGGGVCSSRWPTRPSRCYRQWQRCLSVAVAGCGVWLRGLCWRWGCSFRWSSCRSGWWSVCCS